MLPETIDPTVSLLQDESSRLNLVRWIHQCDLIKRYYRADTVFVLQQTGLGFEVIVTAMNDSPQFQPGTLFDPDFPLFGKLVQAPPNGLKLNLSHFTAEELSRELDGFISILSRPLHWPNGTVFGCLCILYGEMEQADNPDIPPYMLEPFQILLQQDLSLLVQKHRIDSLSMRDRDTGMLNRYGFIMMAPRQLNLGRRFGVNAGLMIFELSMRHPKDGQLEEKHYRLLGKIIQNTIRTADIAAHYGPSQFVVLVFTDSERDLAHIVSRIEKQLAQQAPELALDDSASFFTPDSTAKLGPMLEQTRRGLASFREEDIATKAGQAKPEAQSDYLEPEY
jgi:GGDEF domain-containing protein